METNPGEGPPSPCFPWPLLSLLQESGEGSGSGKNRGLEQGLEGGYEVR